MEKSQIKQNARIFIGTMFVSVLKVSTPSNVDTIAEIMADHLFTFGLERITEHQMAGAFKVAIETI